MSGINMGNELYKLYRSANEIGFKFEPPKAKGGYDNLKPESITHEKIDTKGFEEEDLNLIKKMIFPSNFEDLKLSNTNELYKILKEYTKIQKVDHPYDDMQNVSNTNLANDVNELYKHMGGPASTISPIAHLYIACQYYNYKTFFIGKMKNNKKMYTGSHNEFPNVSFERINDIIKEIYSFDCSKYSDVNNLTDEGKFYINTELQKIKEKIKNTLHFNEENKDKIIAKIYNEIIFSKNPFKFKKEEKDEYGEEDLVEFEDNDKHVFLPKIFKLNLDIKRFKKETKQTYKAFFDNDLKDETDPQAQELNKELMNLDENKKAEEITQIIILGLGNYYKSYLDNEIKIFYDIDKIDYGYKEQVYDDNDGYLQSNVPDKDLKKLGVHVGGNKKRKRRKTKRKNKRKNKTKNNRKRKSKRKSKQTKRKRHTKRHNKRTKKRTKRTKSKK